MSAQLSEQAQNLLLLIPESGSIGNVTLRKKFYGPVGLQILEANDAGQILDFAAAKSELLAAGIIKLGRGKGGSVKRAIPTHADLNLETGEVTETLESKPSPETVQVEKPQTETAVAAEEF